MIALRDSVQAFLLRLQELLPRMQGLLLAFFSDHWRSVGSEGSEMNE
jgi:hypothetical protein